MTVSAYLLRSISISSDLHELWGFVFTCLPCFQVHGVVLFRVRKWNILPSIT